MARLIGWAGAVWLALALGSSGCGWDMWGGAGAGALNSPAPAPDLPAPACADGHAACVVGLEVEGPPTDGLLGLLFPVSDSPPRFRFGRATVSFQVRAAEPDAQVRRARVWRDEAPGGEDAPGHWLDLTSCEREDVPEASLAGPGMAASFRCDVPVPWVFPGPQHVEVTVALDPAAPADDLDRVVALRDDTDAPGAPALEVMCLADADPGGATGSAGGRRLWVGTLHDGLALVELPTTTSQGLAAVAHYRGIDLNQPYDPAYPGPQSNYVTTLAPEPASPAGRALWVGTWATGVALFDPGEDLASQEDDRWTALLPPQLYPPFDPDLDPGAELPEGQEPDTRWVAQDMMETPTALLPDPAGDGLWVGTLNGLFFVRHGGALSAQALAASPWLRVADGAVFSLVAGEAGAVWAGLSTEVVADALPEAWPPAQAPLLRVTREAAQQDGDEPSFAVEALWPPLAGAAASGAGPETVTGPGAALALATDAQGALWVGGTMGIFRVTGDAGGPGGGGALRWDDQTAALGLAGGDGVPLAVTALAVDGAGGLFVGASARCQPDVGALVWRPASGAPMSLAAGLPDTDVVALAVVGGDLLASTSQVSLRGLSSLSSSQTTDPGDDGGWGGCSGDTPPPAQASLARWALEALGAGGAPEVL